MEKYIDFLLGIFFDAEIHKVDFYPNIICFRIFQEFIHHPNTGNYSYDLTAKKIFKNYFYLHFLES